MSSAKMEMSIDDPQFAARTRAEDPEALRAVVHTYLGQILRAARSQQRFCPDCFTWASVTAARPSGGSIYKA